MRNSSSDSSGRPGKPPAGKKSSGNKSNSRPYAEKPRAAKKNYDGREPSGSGGTGTGKSRPYSGRVTDADAGNYSSGPASGRPRSGSGPRAARDGKPFDGARRGEKSGPRPARDGKPFDGPRRSDNSDRPSTGFSKPKRDDRTGDGDKPFSRKSGPGSRPGKPQDKDRGNNPFKFKPRPRPAAGESGFNEAGSEQEGGTERPDQHRKAPFNKNTRPGDSRPFRERTKPGAERPVRGKFDSGSQPGPKEKGPKTFSDVVNNVFNEPAPKNKDLNDDDHPGKRQQFEDKVYGELPEAVNEEKPKKPYELKQKAAGKKRFVHDHSEGRKKKYKETDDEDEDDKEISQKDGPRLEMPLNKFIAHSGECSRRDAAELVKQGKVKVNGELVLDPGYRVKHDDKVTMSGKKLTPQKGFVYILLNKPKGFITTNDDPQGRKTVMDLVGNSGVDRLYPVGRLDRDTSGLLLITNDGDLTQRLSHPAFNIKKVYQVTLDKPLTKADFDKIIEGVELEDGRAVVDALSYLEKKNELGLEIHSGRNRIVRRIFESLGYVVEKLDRVMYAGLTKKNLPRSKWRYLDEREVVLLKHFKS